MSEQFIEWAKKQLNSNDCVITKERHGDQSDVFKFEAPGENYFLKIGNGLEKERERLEWLKEKVPVPKVVGYMSSDGKDALLLSAIEGQNLAVLKNEWPAEKIISKLVEALKNFHAIDATDCPFGNYEKGKILVHGDACLPNFIFSGDKFSGYIDLGDMTIGDREVDFAAAIWSLDYNLGDGHGLEFLKKYGIENATEEMAKKLKLKYEEMQEEWGL